jgi:hypothetical protein
MVCLGFLIALDLFEVLRVRVFFVGLNFNPKPTQTPFLG